MAHSVPNPDSSYTSLQPPPEPENRLRASKWLTPAQRASGQLTASDNTGPKRPSQQAEYNRKKRQDDQILLQRFKTSLVDTSFWGRFWNPRKRPTLVQFRMLINDLAKCALRAFPRRMELPVFVCDIYADRGELFQGSLGNIESYWKDKPEGVVIRWIHAPLGVGLIHSSIEDMFRHDADPGRAYPRAGGVDFPYLEVDLLHFREREELVHLRDVYKTLHNEHEVTELLTKDCLKGDQNATFATDLSWREAHCMEERDFWTLSTPDVPLELSEHLAFNDHNEPKRPAGLQGEVNSPSLLSIKTAPFHDAQLVVAPLRCFHRKDGMILTMSAATGVDQLQKSFAVDLKEPLVARLRNTDASVLGNMMFWLKDRGASEWHDTSVEWFMIYLVTEVAIVPTNITSGISAASILVALQDAVLYLKGRRHDGWQQDQTPQLYKDYIACVDGLRLLSGCHERKISFLARLREDLQLHQKEDGVLPPIPNGHLARGPHNIRTSNSANTALERVEWATSILQREKAAVDLLVQEVGQSLEGFFQLRIVEQNERAITTDLQNKAFFIFATITVVFLPLSVFTSYFGMNLVDIRDTAWSQREFWSTLGTSAIAIVVAIGVVATNYHSLYEWLRGGGPKKMFQRD